ncbi:hypothetical protein [Burkholderia phage FLC9]|nr:hypothetical protein [Burkholderia phage FLC9]
MIGWVTKLFRKQPPLRRQTWGANPDCPKCGQRTVTFDILNHQVYCCRCQDVVYRLQHWPVPADYLKTHGIRLSHVVPPQYKQGE